MYPDSVSNTIDILTVSCLGIISYTNKVATVCILFQYPILLDTAEDNVVDITSVMVMTEVEEGQMNTFDLDDTISFTILKSKGKDLPFHYQTQYGSVTLPYWETFQDKNKNKMLAFCVRTQSNIYLFFRVFFFKFLCSILKKFRL